MVEFSCYTGFKLKNNVHDLRMIANEDLLCCYHRAYYLEHCVLSIFFFSTQWDTDQVWPLPCTECSVGTRPAVSGAGQERGSHQTAGDGQVSHESTLDAWKHVRHCVCWSMLSCVGHVMIWDMFTCPYNWVQKFVSPILFV